MVEKRQIGLLLACIGLFMCFFFRSTITFMQNELDFEEKILDLELVSVDDYTITGSIPKDLYQRIMRQTEFVEAATRKRNDTNFTILKPIKRFEEYLIQVIQANLSHHQKKKAKKNSSEKLEDAPKQNKKEMARIVEIVYAFENRYMLRSLLALNKELAKLGSIIPGCCSRLWTRRVLRKKVVAQTDDFLLARLKENTKKNKKQESKRGIIGCK